MGTRSRRADNLGSTLRDAGSRAGPKAATAFGAASSGSTPPMIGAGIRVIGGLQPQLM